MKRAMCFWVPHISNALEFLSNTTPYGSTNMTVSQNNASGDSIRKLFYAETIITIAGIAMIAIGDCKKDTSLGSLLIKSGFLLTGGGFGGIVGTGLAIGLSFNPIALGTSIGGGCGLIIGHLARRKLYPSTVAQVQQAPAPLAGGAH